MQGLAEQLSPNNEHEQLDQAVRVRTDTETWLAEALNGSMRTTFEYRFDGQELYGEDGGSVGEIFNDAITSAQEVVRYNPGLLFELRRRLIERGEYEDMVKMANGELPNTMIVISDFPPELMDSREDVGGYNASRKQTMLRVITRQKDGSIRMTTQSLEGSDREALEAIYTKLGVTVEAGELLEQRVHRDLPTQWQGVLVDNLTTAYDSSLSDRFGGDWHAGFKQPDRRSWVDTFAFAHDQQDVVEWFTKEKLRNPKGAEDLRFKLAATVSQRYEDHLAGAPEEIVQSEVAIQGVYRQALTHDFYLELEQAADRAIAAGMTFSGCGATVSGSLEEQLQNAGYGNKSDDCEFISKSCPLCGTKNVKTKVTKSHISGSCGCSKSR